MNLSPQIRAYLIEVRKDLTKQIDSKDMIASGRMRRNLRVVANQHLEGEIRGERYTEWLTIPYIKKPSGVSPEFVQRIISWMRFKGITPDKDRSIEATANAIAYKIVEFGTKWSKPGKGLDIPGAMERHKSKYLESIGESFLLEFSNKLTIKRKK